jgi:hypothetical protein
MHQNAILLHQLQDGYRRVIASQHRGITFFRDTLTRFYWDNFLKHFNFGRGGPLKVSVEVPGFDSESSEIHTWVRIQEKDLLADENGSGSNDDLLHAQEALAWVLDALYIYAFDLGLVVTKRAVRKENE